MVLRCHFDIFSSRGVQIDPFGDDFDSTESARKMARALLIDFARHYFSSGEECMVVCKITTMKPERYYLTSIALLDDFMMRPAVDETVTCESTQILPRRQACLDSADDSEVAYRMSADWTDLRELRSDGFLHNVSSPERALFMNYIPWDERPRVAAAIDRAIQFRVPFNLEHKIVRADESIGWTRSRALPVVDEHGRISEWVGVAKDVTARHRA